MEIKELKPFFHAFLGSISNRLTLGFLLLCLVMVQLSCNAGQIYKRYIALPDGVWSQSDRVRFVVPVSKPISNAKVLMLIRFTDVYEYNNLKFEMSLRSPQNAILEQQEYDMPMKTENGLNSGTALGDIWDSKMQILENYQFTETGNYTFDFAQAMPDETLPFMTELGLVIEQE